MKKSVTSFAATFLCGCIYLATADVLRAQTTNVAITNYSFETPVGADGVTSVGLSGWTVIGNSLGGIGNTTPLNETVLTQNPTDAYYPGTSGSGTIGNLDGNQIASFRTGTLNLVGGSASQVTGELLAVGRQYVLTIAVGNPLGSVFQGYTISLLAAGTTLASVNETTGGTPADGTFQNVTLTYTLGALNSLVNSPLVVNVAVPNGLTLTTGYGTDFDNVRLTSTAVAVPEPSTYASVGLGLLGLVGIQRAKRRKSDRA